MTGRRAPERAARSELGGEERRDGPRGIVALDVPNGAQARLLVGRLGDACDFYKVGSELFTAEGPRVVEWLRSEGKEVFLDLKLHDIPNTVRGAARAAAALDVSLLTVHAAGGPAMLEAAVEGAGDRAGVMAVTVLTSLGSAELSGVRGGARPIEAVEQEVLRLAGVAADAGLHGVVCAGSEVQLVRRRFGNQLALLVPGIRLTGSPADDQARAVTPSDAVRAGADYLVLGRTVTSAPDPGAAWSRALAEMTQP